MLWGLTHGQIRRNIANDLALMRRSGAELSAEAMAGRCAPLTRWPTFRLFWFELVLLDVLTQTGKRFLIRLFWRGRIVCWITTPGSTRTFTLTTLWLECWHSFKWSVNCESFYFTFLEVFVLAIVHILMQVLFSLFAIFQQLLWR